MDETDENMSADDVSIEDSSSSVKVKPKKRSLIERELETSLTARVTSPVTNGDTSSTSRYGRARRLKTDPEYSDSEKASNQIKSPVNENTPVKVQSPVYKMHASNSPIKTEPKESPKKVIATDSSLENQIDNIYNENISLSRFGSEEKNCKSPGPRFPKVYVRKDLIQKREKEETVVLIKNMFSPVQSPYKSTSSHLNNILERSSEKYNLNTTSQPHNGYLNTSSVVKTLDFDSNKKRKKENRDSKTVLSKSDLFDMEAKCEYQVGDLAWARMGTYPFWPCIVTREPSSGMFVKNKLFGRIERDVIHVTFFGDNGRRGWIVDTMLRKFLGQLEFETTRERFSPSAKKRDPRLYAAFFVTEKKMPQWTLSVEEAETLLREPKRLRIDILNDMLIKNRLNKSATKTKSGKITRTASDVSLSESLYDTLFSEDDGKAEDSERSKSKTRKSLDVSEVVTACLDNMAAKTGITKIQRQSHMDRWLQKAKSKTPEKLQTKVTPQKKEKEVKVISSKKKKVSPRVPKQKPYSFRKSVYESQNLKSHHNEHDYSTNVNVKPEDGNEVVESYDTDVVDKVVSVSDEEFAKQVEEIQPTKNEIDTTEDASSSIDKDVTDNASSSTVIRDTEPQEIEDIIPIITTDGTVDEMQESVCSVEGDAESESIKVKHLEKKFGSKKVYQRMTRASAKNKKSTDMNNVVFDSTKQIEILKVEENQEKDINGPSESSETTVEDVKSISDKIECNWNMDVNNSKLPNDLITQIEDKMIDSENHLESMDIDSGNVSDEVHSNTGDIDLSSKNRCIVLEQRKKSDINTEKIIQNTPDSESTTKISEVDTKKLEGSSQIDSDKPRNSTSVLSDDRIGHKDSNKPVLRRRMKRPITSETTEFVLNDTSTPNNSKRPILTRKRNSKKYERKGDILDKVGDSTVDPKKEHISLQSAESCQEEITQLDSKSRINECQVESVEQEIRLENFPHVKPTENVTTDETIDENEKPCKEIKQIELGDALKATQADLETFVKDKIDSQKALETIESSVPDTSSVQEEQRKNENVTSQPKLIESSSTQEEDMEYGHLEFTEKASNKLQDKGLVESTLITQKENNLVNTIHMESEVKEYDHLDFIFSSYDEECQENYTDVKGDSNMFEKHGDVSNSSKLNEAVPKYVDTDDQLHSDDKIEDVDNIETTLHEDKTLASAVELSDSKLQLLNVDELPLSDFPSSPILNDSKEKNATDNSVQLDCQIVCTTPDEHTIDENKLLNDKDNTKNLNDTNNGDQCDSISDMSVDDDLDERLILQDSFEKVTDAECEHLRINETNNENNVYINNLTNEVTNDHKLTDDRDREKEANIKNSHEEENLEKSENASDVFKSVDCLRESVGIERIEPGKDNGTVNCINIVDDDNVVQSVNDNTITDQVDEIKETKDTAIDIDSFVMSVNRLPEPVKLNGFHVDECLDFSDGEFNAETSSINSEDSEPLSVTKTKLLMKKGSESNKVLEDTEFVKYLELRQDELMDEHPELSQDEIIEYLYKTWQYEENAKPDLVKNDDIEQSGLVKGLNQNVKPRKSRNNFRDKKTSKKRDEDTLSINSDISDTSARRRLRTRIAKSPATSIEDSEISINKEMCLEIKSELLDNISVNSDVSYSSMKYTPIDNTLAETGLPESKDDDANHVDNNKSSPDKTMDKSNDAKVKEKTKSPKNKEDSIKSYFKSTNSESKSSQVVEPITIDKPKKIKEEYDPDTASIHSEDSEVSQTKKRRKYGDKNKTMTDPEFLKYVELRQDPLIDENPLLTQDEIMSYLYKTWLYEENAKSDLKKSDDLEQASLVKGLNQGPTTPQHKRVKKKIKVEKDLSADEEVPPKNKPKRKISQPYYNEDLSDIEDEIELFEIFKPKKKLNLLSDGKDIKTEGATTAEDQEVIEIDEVDEVELYFAQLTEPKPNVFKGLVREKVCEICEKTGNLVKCKGCNSMFHSDCVKKEKEIVEVIPEAPSRGRKKKKKNVGRKPKSLEDSESHSDEKSQDVSEELNASMEEEFESRTVNAEDFEAALTAKMQELLPTVDVNYDSYSSDDGLDWNSAPPGKCEIVDVKLKPKTVTDYSNFKCNKCEKHNTPVCFVCKQAVSKTGVEHRQRCQTAHCHKYYHLECLDHWPQTQFNSGEPSKSNKKINEHFESLMCPRHVCHTCVSDDPRGCKTRFSGDKLARCVRCPATYHSFTKCLPAGSQILTGSLIVCPRHYEHRPGKVPCHVNTGWCFICALGGSLICCEYCPTSFHAECLNIKPPEGGYMCEDCETGRLPLYGEMVWVKLGHYRWWPGIILHPSEIPENIMAVKHSPGEFVVRFFGQYDHYWVNRGRVFPFQEGDSGKVSSQKSKIDAAFTTAMEHAQRACEILKTAVPNEEESLDIASSLLPPHYVKLKVNKPCGSVCGRRVDLEESSLTQCECSPSEEDPCGPYSHCLNRMLLTECGPACRAGERCSNRGFERRRYPRLVPYRTPQRGWGLKTLEPIKAGQFVIEYVGELIDEEEFRRRMNRKHEIRDENFYFLTLDKERMIDAGPKGNLARFMNHCCEPNCETQKWTVLGDIRVGLFALYDIPANSELTFNYNLQCAGIEKKRCMCGARRCSGYIGAKPKQEESQSKKNKVPAKRAYKKRKNAEESPSTSKNKPKRPVGRPAKPRELTEIEKDLLIIKNATNGLSSDSEGSGRLSSIDSERNPKALKRKRVSFSTEECSKKARVDEKTREVGD